MYCIADFKTLEVSNLIQLTVRHKNREGGSDLFYHNINESNFKLLDFHLLPHLGEVKKQLFLEKTNKQKNLPSTSDWISLESRVVDSGTQ